MNALAPGLTMSEAMKSNPSWSGAVVTNNIASRAIKREALPENLLGALVFLASPESDFITGQTLSVDGGSVMERDRRCRRSLGIRVDDSNYQLFTLIRFEAPR